ncbi:MAG: DNA integrity scanning diadenylate cyclase DisA [Coriobacteriales bacterium]|jgi:diadenylate cyclase|nr:DNA integrity scanning diadenylate cyclase DisA [Coriobacteriales bacterium]
MNDVHSILPERDDNFFDGVIKMVASGMPLREAIDMIISAQNGALICIGDVEKVLMLGNGGFKIDQPFTPQRLFELSKMDGAIVLSEDLKQIVCANFHLNPDPEILTPETGMRHRSAARTSAQTDATVIAISKRRVQTTLYHTGEALTLDSDAILLTKGNQGLLALQNLKNTLERASMRLSFLELDDIATVADVTNLIKRYCTLLIIAVETERYINFLGSNSGLLRNQLEEIVGGMVDSFMLVIRDYAVDDSKKSIDTIASTLLAAALDEGAAASTGTATGAATVAATGATGATGATAGATGSTAPDNTAPAKTVMELLGHTQSYVDEDHISPRGFRAISRISMLDEVAVSKIVEEYGSLSAIVSDSKDGFDRLEDLGVDNVRAIAKSFMQLRSTL